MEAQIHRGGAGRVSVLIVDDEAGMRDLLRRTIEGFTPYQVVSMAGSADEAASAAARHAPTLALVDYDMPGGGPAAVAGILARSPRTRVVAVSGHDDLAVVRQMLRAGAVSYVLKGTPAEELERILRHALLPDAPATDHGAAERNPATTVLVAEADPTAIEMLAEAIDDAPGLELVGLAQTPFHALQLAARHQPSVALVNRAMSDGLGAVLAADLLAVSPGTKVIGLGIGDTRAGLDMLAAGATSVINDPQDAGLVVAAIARAASGGSELAASVAQAVLNPLRLPGGKRQRRRRRFERVHTALALDALGVALQPIVSFAGGRACGYEALARFPLLPSRSPDVWFAEAHRAGVGHELEMLALRSALNLIDHIPAGRYLAINVSPETLLSDQLHQALAEVPGSQIVLELTEHAPVHDYAAVRSVMDGLRKLGIRLAVDDAGAGFASLRHVALLEPEFLKLDLMLCRDVREPVKMALARALVAFGDETGSIVIAEGIEAVDDLDALREIGIEYGQGYLFAKPAPVDVALASAA
jgi:EAL domain-containing protein (putative c-di-GMP-specific phosphodiesterase class I)/DNA-binding NarL/FixJ family response regulator